MRLVDEWRHDASSMKNAFLLAMEKKAERENVEIDINELPVGSEVIVESKDKE